MCRKKSFKIQQVRDFFNEGRVIDVMHVKRFIGEMRDPVLTKLVSLFCFLRHETQMKLKL